MSETYFVTTSGSSVTGAGFTPDGTVPPGAVACTSAQAAAAGPWSSIVSGALVVGAPPAPSLAAQAAAALSAGLAITSTATAALNGTYDVSGASQDHMQAEMIALLNSAGATFADGTTTVVWPDMSGVNHTFDPAQGKAFFLAVGTYVAALYKCINGTLATLPAATATIP